MSSGLHAQQSDTLSYPASFFADARPNTAYDMISRLPGFTFTDVTTARGFGGTAGNVLIGGQRPTSKTDTLQAILQRIPASDVERIDLIRGGAPGIDMHGQTVVANVLRKKADSTEIVAEIEDNIFTDTGETLPNLSLQYTRHSGDSTYEVSITRYGSIDDSVGKGTHRVTDVATGEVTRQPAYDNGIGTGGALTGAVTVPLFGGEFKANLSLQDQPFHSAFFYLAPNHGGQVIKDVSGNRNGELGLHWNGHLGGLQVESLFLQRLSHLSDVNTSNAPNDDERFTSASDNGESIARETLRYSPQDGLTFEGGDRNRRDGRQCEPAVRPAHAVRSLIRAAFPRKRRFHITFMHEQIRDVVDFVPVTAPDGTVCDAPGNIGDGTNEKLDFSLTLPLDRLGLKNGLFKTTNDLQWSRVPDPTTGQERVISGQRPTDRGDLLYQMAGSFARKARINSRSLSRTCDSEAISDSHRISRRTHILCRAFRVGKSASISRLSGPPK